MEGNNKYEWSIHLAIDYFPSTHKRHHIVSHKRAIIKTNNNFTRNFPNFFL